MSVPVSYSPYSLSPSRMGAVLRFEFEEGEGFADCHPWPELGDAPLGEQLSRLGRGELTSLGSRSLAFARLDARARSGGRSLFEGLAIPRSHLLLLNPAGAAPSVVHGGIESGFDRLKVKVGRKMEEELPALRRLSPVLDRVMKLRLDFNSLPAREELARFLDGLGSVLEQVDFLEDPLAWREEDWSWIRERFAVRVAMDREWSPGREAFADLVVVKPAIQATPETGLPLVFTSYLDHPLGQACAAYEAGVARAAGRTVETCGLQSHGVYPESAFSRALGGTGPAFIAPAGTGFGFDAALAELRWERLP